MEFIHFTLFLSLLINVHSIVPRCNIISENLNFGVNSVPNSVGFKNRYFNGSGLFGSVLFNNKYLSFVRGPSFFNPRINKTTLKLTEDNTNELKEFDEQKSTENVSDFNTNKPQTPDNYHLNTSNASEFSPLYQNSDSVYEQSGVNGSNLQNSTETVGSVLNPNEGTGFSESKTATSCKLVEPNEGVVGRVLSKLNLKRDLSSLSDKLKKVKLGVESALYPSGASKEVIHFTNWKMLERTFLSLSSTVGLNVKPLSVSDVEQDKDMVGFLKSKLAKTKLSTLLFASVFKDLVSRVLNFYWFNKCIRVSDNPRAYRIMSTFGVSILSLWDFFINLNCLEPKTLLLAVNHVFKQVFTQTINAINQHYYSTSNHLNNIHEMNPLMELTPNGKKMSPANGFKDDFNFIFDILGMCLGMYASYLINEVNSNELKIFTIGSNLLISNLLTLIVTRFLKR